MTTYTILSSGDIVAEIRPPIWSIPMQKVLYHSQKVTWIFDPQIVTWIFDYRRSHFSVWENEWIFQGYSLEYNFELLRKMCSLWDPTTEHVTSLITEFSLTDEHWEVHTVEVWEWKYKSALFLYWLAEWKDEFIMDDNLRQYVWDYFWHEICDDAMNNPSTKHTTVRYLLNQWGSRVRITRP